MGVTFGVVCEKCGIEAPEVGDFGYIGAPSLGLRKRRDGLQTFGFIYEGLEAIGVVTEEIEAFKTFLDEHRGHRIALYGDGVEVEEEIEENGESERDAAPARAKPFRFTRRFRQIFHELHCETCHATRRSSESVALRPFEPFAVSIDRIKLFHERVVATEDSLHRVFGFPFDEVAGLDEFLRQHRRHHLIARLAGGKTAPRPKGVAPKARAIEPWAPPEWPPEASEHALGPVADEDLPALMSLRQRDPAVRREAALQIGRLRKPALLGYLVSMLDDPEATVRAAAVTAIGAIPDARVGRPLGRALFDESEDVRSTARDALRDAGISEADARAEARSPRGPYTKPAGRVEASIAGFERALGDPRASEVRYEAVKRLAKSRTAGASGLLLRALADPWDLVRHEAAEALAAWPRDPRVIPALMRSLTEYGDAPDRSAIVSLGALRAEAAIPALRGLLLSNAHPDYYRIVDSIVRIGGRAAADALADALTHPSKDVRLSVAVALTGMQAPHVAPRFLVALSDPDERVRQHAAIALQQTDTPEVARALVEAYRTGGQDERGVIVESLGKISGPEPLRVLVAALRERSTMVRAAAARELDARNDPRGNRALIAAARRGDATVGLNAWPFFVGQGAPGTEPALERALFEDDRERSTEMAAGLLTCGNAGLARAARTWLDGSRPKAPKIAWGGKPRPV